MGARASATNQADPLAVVLEVSPHVKRVVGPGGAVFLIGEQERFVIRERLHSHLLLAFDGIRPLGDVLTGVAEEFSADQVMAAVAQLVERGYVGPAAAGLTPAAAAWWRGSGVSPQRVERALEFFSVSLEFVGRPLDWFANILADAGVRVDPGGACKLVVCDDYLDPAAVHRLDQLSQAGEFFIPLKPVGRSLWIGPIFAPDSTRACWRCLWHRLVQNRPVEAFIAAGQEKPAFPAPPAAALPATVRLAACFAAVKLAEAASDPLASPLLDHLLAFDLRAMEPRFHPVVRRPQCLACGDATWMKRAIAAPVQLSNLRPLDGQDGGHRIVTAEETWQRCVRLISPVTGVLARVAPHDQRHQPQRPTFVTGYHVRPADDELQTDETFFRPAFGKGRSVAQARASALAEGLERHASLFQGDEPVVNSTLAGLGREAIHPHDLLNFSPQQYRERDPNGDWHHNAPLPFSEDLTLPWTPAWSLTHGCRRYLPTSFCFNQTPLPPDARVCPFDPNGHAAGNCKEEAILQGLLELVERDAVGIWWYNRLRKPGFAADAFPSDFFRRTRDEYQGLGWQLWALDLTTDLGIPVVAAIARASDGRFVAGFGCHLDAGLAVERAVSEINQIFEPATKSHALWWPADLPNPDFVHPDRDRSLRGLADFPGFVPADLAGEIGTVVDRLRATNLETIVLDYSRPDLVLATVKVVVPGLRHFWRRLGPGRLYEVPVRMGERTRPLREDELNPTSLKA
jgi:bacteriocin biosynthesis cyclodehydratase domain-containing protein